MFLIITSIVHLRIYILLHDICFHPKLQESWKMAKVLAFVLISFFFTDGIPATWGSGFRQRVVCEGRKSTISCGNGYTLSIIRANYGRNSRRTCPSSLIRTTRCNSPRSSGIIKRSCNGRRSCSLFASNSVFGDPCYGTYKYIWVLYRCRRSAYNRVVLCEGRRRRISCPWGRVISITRASYGRKERNTCPSHLIRTTSCSASRSSNIIKRKCHYKRSCLLHASNSVFGDPCRGTYKYLSVTYSCIRRRYKVGVACEGRPRWITCPYGRKIRVRYANYGRTNRRTCHHSLIRTTHCYAPHSKSKVAASCNGRRYCLLRPFNYVFGDPCYGTYKYLLVHYYCI